MGTIAVHEFVTLDGVIDNPSWTFDYSFDPKMGDAIAAIMGASKAILLGRRTYELFAPTWSTRTAADDPEDVTAVVPGDLPGAPSAQVTSSGLSTWTTASAFQMELAFPAQETPSNQAASSTSTRVFSSALGSCSCNARASRNRVPRWTRPPAIARETLAWLMPAACAKPY